MVLEVWLVATVKSFRGSSWPIVDVSYPSLNSPTLKFVYESSLMHWVLSILMLLHLIMLTLDILLSAFDLSSVLIYMNLCFDDNDFYVNC